MEDLTFGEQVKIILSRKGMTIKELAELIEASTGKKMSRQNLTQRLGRDNFQEQDMRMIAAILGCPFQLSIFPMENASGEKAESSMEELLLKYVKHPRVQPKRKKEDMGDGIYQQVLVFDKEPEAKENQPKDASPESKGEQPKDISPSGGGTGEAAAAPGVQKEAAAAGAPDSSRAAGSAKDTPSEKSAAFSSSTGTKKLPDITAAMRALAEKQEEDGGDEELIELDVLDAEDSEDLEETEFTEQEADSKGQSSIIVAAEKKGERTVIEERDMTIGELYDIHRELRQIEEDEIPVKETAAPAAAGQAQASKSAGKPKQQKPEDFEPVIRYTDAEENLELGEMNPYTGREYQTNSVRMHPTRLGYVQVYDRLQHGWTDMTEWAFLGYQERKKALLGRDYEPPIYLD